ncbi:MAG: O-antigen ligase C-terminal domain-containing protein [Variovorax sp.]|nr:O-antigen ligase C-terminal domain-containing protein [Variovorax sp.]
MSRAAVPARAAPAGRYRAVAALVAVPFLFPLTGGPLGNAWQALFAGGCAVVLAMGRCRSCSGTSGVCGPAAVFLAGVALAAISGVGLAGALFVIGCGFLAGRHMGPEGAYADDPSLALGHGMALAACVSVAIGLVQYFGHAAWLAPWAAVPMEPLGMAYGNLRQRNQFASLCCMGLVAALWLQARASAGGRTGWGIAAAWLVVGLAASTSRTGLLALICVIVAAAWLGRQQRRSAAQVSAHPAHPAFVLAALPLYAGAAWLLPRLASGGVEGMISRLREGAPPGHGRLVLWQNVLELIAQHPWRGWGWGELSYAHYSHLYASERFVEILDNAHNLPLHLAVTLGIPAAVAICGGFVWMVLRARPWAERDPARVMVWGLLGVVVLHSLLEYPLWYAPFQLVFGLCLGFLWPGRAVALLKPNRPFATVLSALVATISIAVLAGVAWDYTRVSQIYLPRAERLPAWREHTLDRLRGRSWFFGDAVKFAELTLTPVTRGNAAAMYDLAGEMLHFSPEPRVVVKRIQAASLLGQDDEVQAQLARFRAAYPEDYLRWLGSLPAD